MKIAVTGAAGFIGKKVSLYLAEKGLTVTGIDLAPVPDDLMAHTNYTYIRTDTRFPGKWQKEIEKADVTVNLAGRNIFGLWTKGRRTDIYESRILTTRNVAEAAGKNAVLVNASAVGFYGDRGDDIISENDDSGMDFLANVCKNWESEAEKALKKDARLVILRFGVVIGRNGGALKKMIPAYRAGAGGHLGSGNQWFAWIHIDDLMEIIRFSIEKEISGVFNACSPGMITNRQFSSALAEIMKVPNFFSIPKLLLATLPGEFGSAITSSQRAYPQKLIDLGFEFKYKDIYNALSDSLS